MSLRNRWSEAQILSTIRPALVEPFEARIRFNTLDAAEKFRFACYSLRRRNRNAAKGLDGLSFILEHVLGDDGSAIQFDILVQKTPMFEIRQIE